MMYRHVGSDPITVGGFRRKSVFAGSGLGWCDGSFERALCRALASVSASKRLAVTAWRQIRIVVDDEEGNLQRAASEAWCDHRALPVRNSARRTGDATPGREEGLG